MDGGINSDQNFYSRPPFPRPPTTSNDDGDRARYDYDYDNPSTYDRPPLVPPKVSLATTNLLATTVNGYGAGATGEADSPAPDDFYRNFDAFRSSGSNSYNMTNGMNTTSSAPRHSPSSLRSNGNGTTPKHPIIPPTRNGPTPTNRSVSTPIDQRMASLNTAKSTPALNSGYTKPSQQTSVRDLLKKFDENKAESTVRKPVFRPVPNGLGGVGYNRLRTSSDNLPSSSINTSRAGLASREAVDRAKSPSVSRTQRARFAIEDQYSNNTLSSVARPGRSPLLTENAQATKSMTNLSPRVPPKPIQTPVRRPLFGEVVAPDGSSSLGYGIVDTRARRTSESSLHRPGLSHNNTDDEPTSPSAWYRAVTPALLDDVESRSLRSRKHNRSQSDVVGGKVSPANGSTQNTAPSQSRLPVISKPLSTHTEVKTPPSTRAASPLAAKTTPIGVSKNQKPDPRPWSPAGKGTPPSHSRSPRPSPGKIITNSSLKAYISAPPPKTSPPLRSSRPRQPVSSATTASSRSKVADKIDFRNGTKNLRSRASDSRSSSRMREPSPSNEQLKAAAARATMAISRNIEQREVERRRRDLAEHPTMGGIASTPQTKEESRPISPSAASPRLTVNTSFLSTTPSLKQVSTSNADLPTMGMPGSFPDNDYDETPYSAISAATGVTEFDNETQTEPPQPGGEPEPPQDSEPFQFEAEEVNEDVTRQSTLTDNGSIKIILDTASMENAESMPAKMKGEQLQDLEAASDQIQQPGDPIFTTTEKPLHFPAPLNASYDVASNNTAPETRYFDHEQYFGEPTVSLQMSSNFEDEKLNEWATSTYHPPALNLPYLNTDVDYDSTRTRPDYLETPVTEIDYESSEAGGEAPPAPCNDTDRLAGSLSTLSSRQDRGSQQSAWTNYTVETNDYSWQEEPAYPAPAPPSIHAQRPTPPPKEQLQYFKADIPPKSIESSPLLSAHTPGDTPNLSSHSQTSVASYAGENGGFNHFQAPPILPLPALPNHSPPPLPQDPLTQKANRTPPPASYRRPMSSVQRDSESIRTSDDVSSSRPSQSTTRTSNQISDRESLQPTDETRPIELVGEEKEAAEKQSRRLQHRGRVIKEIIDTEAVYLKDMNVVEEIYKGTAEACPKLEHNDVNIIFRNTNQIVAFSTMFLDEIKAASASVYSPRQKARRQSRSTTTTTASTTISPTSTFRDSVSISMPIEESDMEKDRKTFIGANFGRHLPEMQTVYTDFLKSSEKASSRLAELQSDAAVKVWLGECNHVAKDLTAAWDLDALLIKPVQRITRYQLLLKDLLENTCEDHPDFEALKTTCRQIGDLLKNIDELKKRIDTVGKIVGVTRKRKESDVRTGLAKAFGRRDRAITANSNRPPEDHDYAKLHQSWGHDFIQLQIILRDVENYTRKVHTWVNDFLRYLSAIELVMRVKASSCPELESKWARFNMSMRDMGTVALEDHVANIRKQVIEPLEQVIKAYGPPELAMKKRTKRRLDYEKSLTLKAANKKIDEKLTEMVDQYTALNETLKFELPKLSALTMKLGKICLTRLVSIQADWYNIWTAKVKTVLEESEMPKDFTDIIDKFNRDYKYQVKKADGLAILNGSFLDNAAKGRSSQSTQSTTATREDEQRYSPRPSSISNGWSRNPPPAMLTQSRSRGLSVNSDHSPRIPTPDFRRSSGHEFTFSPVVSDSPGLPIFSTRDFPPSNTHTRAGSGSPAMNDVAMSRQNHSRPPTGRSYDSGPISRRSVESGSTARSPSASFSFPQFEGANDSLRDRPPPSSRPYSGLFHSAMPPTDSADDSQRSSRASSQDRERSGGYNVLYIAASLFEFNISATKSEAGYPYLTYGAGEVFDVIGEKGELWLAKNQDDPSDLVGWIWSKHFARLATD